MTSQAQGQASPASPSATSEVDGGAALDGGATRAHGVARERARCLAVRANHPGETLEQTLHAGGPWDGEVG